MSKKTKREQYREVLEDIDKKVTSSFSNFQENIDNYLDDMTFLFLSQWKEDERAAFTNLEKTLMSSNKVYDLYNKVISEYRDVTPNLKARSEAGANNQEMLDMVSGIVRYIAYHSRNRIVYQTAVENAMGGGFGAIRVKVDYKNPKTFQQDIYVCAQYNPDRCFFDPNAKEPTKRDGDYCGTFETITNTEFEKRYPDAPSASGASYPQPAGVTTFTWGDRDHTTIVEIFIKKYFTYTLYALQDGTEITKKDFDKQLKKAEKSLLGDVEDIELKKNPELAELKESLDAYRANPMNGDLAFMLGLPVVIRKRKVTDYKIKQYKAVKEYILEESEWPSKEFPIIFVDGNSKIINGKEHTISFIRYVKDSQRLANYLLSEIADAAKNNRREQWLGTRENFEGKDIEQIWKNPENRQGSLVANPDSMTGQMPQKIAPSEIPQTIIVLYREMMQDIQNVLGIHEANRGAQGQEVSGVALQARQTAGNKSVGVFFDNVERSIEQVGRVILSLIPHVYDTERNVKMLDGKGETKNVKINQQLGDSAINDVRNVDFEIEIEPGPSFAVQREQAMNTLIELVKVGGQEVFMRVADLLAANTDLENTQQLVKRFKSLVPPAVLAEEEGKPPPPPPPNPELELQKQKLQNESMHLQLQAKELMANNQKAALDRELEAAKIQAQFAEIEEKRRAAGLRAQSEIEKAQLDREAQTVDALAKIVKAHSDITQSHHDVVENFINTTRDKQ